MNGVISIMDAILAINNDAKVVVGGDSVDSIVWHEDTPEIPKADILAKKDELQVEYEASEYARDRRKEYPSFADQLDYIYHNSITKWKSDMIKPVKDAHPKP